MDRQNTFTKGCKVKSHQTQGLENVLKTLYWNGKDINEDDRYLESLRFAVDIFIMIGRESKLANLAWV